MVPIVWFAALVRFDAIIVMFIIADVLLTAMFDTLTKATE